MFIDEIKLHLKAGDGGQGVVRWRREKGRPLMGPAGGDGGRGGSVYIKAVRNINLLSRYSHKKEFEAERGAPGESKSLHGKAGLDLTLEVPVGAIVTNLKTGEVFNFLKDGETRLLLKSGKGGLGNEYFKSSTNRSPREWTPGEEGEEANFLIELELVADIGFIGFPNAGKSSLLNALTRAKAKVADYPFTTLEPNLGDFYGYILSDIPGLIEGASEGRGLGHKFLRHIKRTKMLVHLISLENENISKSYKTIRKELGHFSKELLDKPELILLTKTDVIDSKAVRTAVKNAKLLNKNVFTMSLYDDASVKEFSDTLVLYLRKL